MNTLIITPEVADDGHSARVTFSDGTEPLVWTMTPDMGPGLDAGGTAEFALMAALPFAMARGVNLHVRGTVCPVSVGNMELLMANRSVWNPSRLTPVRITADRIEWRGGYDPAGPHIATMSGGVDSTFAVADNIATPDAARHRPVTAGMLIRGFDYSMDSTPGYENTYSAVRSINKRLGIDTFSIESNAARLSLAAVGEAGVWYPYTDFHPSFVAACMHLMEGRFAGGMFAADFDYRNERYIPHWATTSATHPLLSSGHFPVEVRGIDTPRPKKVRALHDMGLWDGIVVCSVADQFGHNCGRCLKCRRTVLMCLAQGLDPGSVFPVRPSKISLVSNPVEAAVHAAFAESTLDAWMAHHLPMLRAALRARLALYPLEQSARRALKPVKRLLRGTK